MTQAGDTASTVNRLVVAFDICSSTAILERLKQIDNRKVWRNLLINLKLALLREGSRYEMEFCNFTGDGWILLFPIDIPTDAVCRFTQAISIYFSAEYRRHIVPQIGSHINPIGLTFGVDSGELVSLVMNRRKEYLGRAINVACRLQAYTKAFKHPSYKALFSMNSFNRRHLPKPTAHVKKEVVELRNISPERTDCLVFNTFDGRIDD